jgi:exodeoxyribonuclease V alpha subunit
MTHTHAVLDSMDTWIARGWLSQLNRAFVRFLMDQDDTATDAVLWAGAWVSHQLDGGEVYLDLAKLCQQPSSTLTIPVNERWAFEQEIARQAGFALGCYRLEDWKAALRHSKLVTLGAGNTPLVLAGNRLYLRRYWCYQQTVNQCIQQRLQPIRTHLPDTLMKPLEALFPASPSQPDWQKIACVVALRARFSIITGGPGTGKTTTLTKLLALLIRLTQDESTTGKKLTILLAAPTGKAAARVSESIAKALNTLTIADSIKQDIPKKASTLHRLLGSRHDSRRFIHNRQHPLVADIVIVDEASMIDLEMMAALLDALPDTTQLILLGDKDQLASVEAGSVMGDLCIGAENAAYDPATRAWINAYTGATLPPSSVEGLAINQQTIMLRHSHRFDAHSGIGQLARAVNAGDKYQAQRVLNDNDTYTDLVPAPKADYLKLRAAPNPDAANTLLKKLVTLNAGLTDAGNPKPCQGYGYYVDVIHTQRPTAGGQYDEWAQQALTAFDSFQILCALRQGYWGIDGLNQRIESWLFPALKPSLWYEGRPVMITRNDYTLGLMNGDIGITLTTDSGKLSVAFPSEDPLADAKIRWVSPLRLPDVVTAFAITVHKSQGSEFHHVALVLPEYRNPVITRELIYTSITRAKTNFTLLESQPDVFNQAVLASCQAF